MHGFWDKTCCTVKQHTGMGLGFIPHFMIGVWGDNDQIAGGQPISVTGGRKIGYTILQIIDLETLVKMGIGLYGSAVNDIFKKEVFCIVHQQQEYQLLSLYQIVQEICNSVK